MRHTCGQACVWSGRISSSALWFEESLVDELNAAVPGIALFFSLCYQQTVSNADVLMNNALYSNMLKLAWMA